MAPASPSTLLPDRFADGVPSDGPGHELGRLGLALGVAVAVAILGLVWSLPFWLGAASGRELAVLPDRTGLIELLAVHGLFVLPFGLYLYARAGELLGTNRARMLGVVTLVTVGLGTATDLAAVGLVGPLLVGAWLLARSPTLSESFEALPALADGGDRPVGFEAVLLAGGAGLVLLVEFAFVRENVGRMNTVFKTYMQVWVLWAVAVGPALAWLLTRWRPTGERARTWVRTGTTVFAVVVLCSTSVYAGLALSDHTQNAGPATLDGMAYLDDFHPEEAEAIRWLDGREGRPVIVTGAPAGYTWNADEGRGASAPASLTGLPTVAGWYHEAQYRNDSVYDQRVQDVGDIYRGNESRQRALLREYDVTYIYSGPSEEVRYRNITVDELDAVEPVHRSGEVVVYEVDQSAL